jgi:hypothetical protein
MKRQSKEWEKILERYCLNKELKRAQKLNIKRIQLVNGQMSEAGNS